MIRNCFVACLLIFTLPALSSCIRNEYDAGSVSTGGNPNILRVGITPNAPPTAYKEQGQITGLEAEFARGLAEFSGKKLRFVELKWNDQIPALLAGKIDIIMSSMTITDARRYRIAFCDPYMISGQVSLVRLKDMYRYREGFTDLLNPSVRIGTVKGTTGDFFIEKNVATDRKQRYFSFQTPQQGVKALIAEKIDAFVYDLPMNFYFAAQNDINGLAPVTIPMTREQIAWGVRKEDTALLQTANAYLAEIKRDGRLKNMLIRWIPFFKNVFNR